MFYLLGTQVKISILFSLAYLESPEKILHLASAHGFGCLVLDRTKWPWLLGLYHTLLQAPGVHNHVQLLYGVLIKRVVQESLSTSNRLGVERSVGLIGPFVMGERGCPPSRPSEQLPPRAAHQVIKRGLDTDAACFAIGGINPTCSEVTFPERGVTPKKKSA